jgi:TusA-related sulfurtransferase
MLEPIWSHRRPTAVLDVGGDTAAELHSVLHRCIDDVLPGEVLHVISHDPGSRPDIEGWCTATSNRLLRFQIHEEESWFWIERAQ